MWRDEVMRVEQLEKVESYTHLCSILDNLAGTDTDVRTHIGKDQVASKGNKLFNTIVKPILL